MKWRDDPAHPRFLVRADGRMRCKTCGKEQPRRTFEELHHFAGAECVGAERDA